jgi:hypothetical protein
MPRSADPPPSPVAPPTLARVRRVLLLVVLVCLLAPAVAAAGRSVPPGWSGMVVNAGVFRSDANAATEWNRMVSTGVESTRAAFYWSDAQYYHSFTDVPPPALAEGKLVPDSKGIPTDFTRTDGIVEDTASRGLTLLPVLLDTPPWAAYDRQLPIAHPRNPSDFANYLTDLIKRYGPNGTFWTLHPDLPKRPIREWQIWNEPNLKYYWPSAHWASQYVALLKTAARAVRAADPGAKVVLSGLMGVSWKALPFIYKAGGRPYFDYVAIHPYTARARDVLRVLQLNRSVMRHAGDSRKPLMLTELSWPSALDSHGRHKTRRHYTIDVTERQQVQRIQEVYPLLARARHSLNLVRVYWYTWVSSERGRTEPFDYAGLRAAGSSDSRAKPAFYAWRSAVLHLEGCRHPKASVSSC